MSELHERFVEMHQHLRKIQTQNPNEYTLETVKCVKKFLDEMQSELYILYSWGHTVYQLALFYHESMLNKYINMIRDSDVKKYQYDPYLLDVDVDVHKNKLSVETVQLFIVNNLTSGMRTHFIKEAGSVDLNKCDFLSCITKMSQLMPRFNPIIDNSKLAGRMNDTISDYFEKIIRVHLIRLLTNLVYYKEEPEICLKYAINEELNALLMNQISTDTLIISNNASTVERLIREQMTKSDRMKILKIIMTRKLKHSFGYWAALKGDFKFADQIVNYAVNYAVNLPCHGQNTYDGLSKKKFVADE